MRVVDVRLSQESVAEAVRQMSAYRSSLPRRVDELLRRLAQAGVDAAVRVVPQDTGELSSSISLERRGGQDYVVVAACGYAAFVEFGTGVVGSGTYRGELPSGWGYDERRTPEAHDPVDPTAWYYYDRDGVLRRTRGQSASGFMLAASEEMRSGVARVAREVFAS